jgi:hypothetical protein
MRRRLIDSKKIAARLIDSEKGAAGMDPNANEGSTCPPPPPLFGSNPQFFFYNKCPQYPFFFSVFFLLILVLVAARGRLGKLREQSERPTRAAGLSSSRVDSPSCMYFIVVLRSFSPLFHRRLAIVPITWLPVTHFSYEGV